MTYQPDNIPLEMKMTPRWLLWKYENSLGNKRTKVPYQANGYHASTTDPKTWTSFNTVNTVFIAEGSPYSGVGFCAGVEADGWVFIDLDHCLKDGKLNPVAQRVVELANSYTEVSPSGDGLHIFLRGYLQGQPPIKISDFGEIDDHAKYFTVTGNVFQNRTELRDVAVEEAKTA
jgi:putative DNA primase/helicase